MDEAHTSRALTAAYQRVLGFGLSRPTESALRYLLSTRSGRGGLRIVMRAILLAIGVIIVATFDLLEFEELFIIHRLEILVPLHLHLVALINLHDFLDYVDLLHCKLDASELYNVATLHDIFNLVVLMLEAPHHEVHVLIQLLRDRGDIFALQLIELLLRRGGTRAIAHPDHRGAPTHHSQH